MTLAAQAADLLPRLRRWPATSWSLPATTPPIDRAADPASGGAADPAPGGAADPAPGGAADPGPGGATAVPGSGGGAGVSEGTRAAVTAAVVQRVADLGADAEGQPRRPVPRLADTGLADQLAVLVDDVLRTGDPAAVEATAAELTRLRTALGFG